MTLLDVLRLVRHYIKMAVLVVIVCTLAGVGVGVVKATLENAEYSAEAVLTISEPTATVAAGELMPLAQAIATNIAAENTNDDVAVSQKYDLATRTISFTAVASSEAESIEMANSAARQTADETAALLREMANQYRSEIQAEESAEAKELDGTVAFGLSERNRAAALEMVSFTVNDASQAASNSGKSAAVKYALVGFLGGVFLALCIVIIIDLVKAPLKDRDDVEKNFDLTILAEGCAADIGDRLWANIQFAADKAPQSICLLPVRRLTVAPIEAALVGAIAKMPASSCGETAVEAYPALTDSMEGAYAARDADATVLCAMLWDDSLCDVADSLRELGLAQADVCGIVLVTGGK